MSISLQRQDIINCLSDPNLSHLDRALKVFHYQKTHNPVYRDFLKYSDRLHVSPEKVEEIPFLPISLFKSRAIQSGTWAPEVIFQSSGTTEMSRSKHMVYSIEAYHQNTTHIWRQYFGPTESYEFIGLLPNYHENPSSSLLSMVSYFMKHSVTREQAYFLNDYQALYHKLENFKLTHTDHPTHKIVLFGVSFALLEYAENFQHQELNNVIVIETGGMKKFRKEISRTELHQLLGVCFSGADIYSEYGMSECMSQMYTSREESSQFVMNDRIKILISDPTDPFTFLPTGRSGRINIIDLANFDTVSFIATDDIGRLTEEGRVEILGRLSNAELRGCNYLI